MLPPSFNDLLWHKEKKHRRRRRLSLLQEPSGQCHYKELVEVYAIKLTANSCIALCSSKKRSQLLICGYNETLSIVAKSVNNPDRTALVISG
jgi:hypothetical protein